MDAQAKNRARNRAKMKRKALDDVRFAFDMSPISRFQCRKSVLAALAADATDEEIGREIRLATLGKAEVT